MENFKRSVKRLITRLVVIGLVVICGAIAIAQANRDRAIVNASEGIASQAATINDAGSSAFNNVKAALGDVGAKVGEASRATHALAVPDLQFNAPNAGAAQQAAVERIAQSPPVTNAQFTAEQPFADERSFGAKFIEDDQVTEAQSIQGAGNRYNDAFPKPEIPGADAVKRTVQGSASRAQGAVSDLVEKATPPDLFQTNDVQPPTTQQPALPTKDTSPFAAGQAQSPAPVEPPPANRFGANDSGDAYTRQFTDTQRSGNALRGGRSLNSQFGNEVRSTQPTQFEQPRVGPPPATSFESTPNFGSSNPPSNSLGSTGNDYATNSFAGAGRPGPSEQEGPQNTGLSIHKIAPRNVRVGEPATFEIKVRNNSRVPAEKVLIRDEVPQGTQLINTNPQAKTGANGGVLWEIGTLRPNEDVVVRMQVTPMQEGNIGSVASVTSQAFASAQSKVTKPQLKITHRTKDKVLVGDPVRFEITIENPGTGPATNVVIEEDVPRGLAHSKGPKLEYEVGTIPPGGTRRLELTLKAAEPGMVQNVIVARTQKGGLQANHKLDLEVVAPKLQLKIKGPTRRYLERKATYSVAIENPGTADAQNVAITTQLPRGLKFVSTNNSGRYDAATHSIRWTLATLPARNFGTVQFTGLPTTKGSFNIAARANADKGLKDSKEHPLAVEGLAALLFEVKDNVDPIEVGGETTYQIRVQNQGTEVAKNVRFVASVPKGMQPVSAEGPTNYRIDGNRIVFEAISSLPAKGVSTYNVRVEGLQENDHRFHVEMLSDGMNTPVVEEESTRVYSDK